MPKLKDILDDFMSHKELREVTQLARLSDTGNKSELIRRLTSGLDDYGILRNLSNEQLQRILRYYEQPTSGRKDTLVERVLLLISPQERREGKKRCEMCEHLYDQSILEKHHYVPRAIAGDWVGGTILLCANCHTVLTRALDDESKKKGHKLLDDEIKRTFNRVKRDVLAGQYGRYGRK